MVETTLCYIENGGNVLLLHRTRKNEDPNRGKWIGVGGHIEPGETPEMCVLREVFEETGLHLLNARYRGIVHFRSDVNPDEDMHLFTATAFTGTLQDCDEGDLKWIPKDEMLNLPMWAGDRVFLRLLQEGREHFECTLQYTGDALQAASVDGRKYEIDS